MEEIDKLEVLIEIMKIRMQAKDLSDSYLAKMGCSTREDIGIKEYPYGITMIPCSWVLPYLEELKEMRNKSWKK